MAKKVWVSFALSAFLATALLLIFYWSWHPPVGIYIGILAFLGVCVPLIREHVGTREKALWTLVMFVLVGFEMKSIYQDRNEHDREQAQDRKDEIQRFRTIADGINSSIQQSQQQFSETVSNIQEGINMDIGGNSFCYVIFSKDQLEAVDAIPSFISVGKYPLSDLDARIVNLDEYNKSSAAPDLEGFLTSQTMTGLKVKLGDIASSQALINPLFKLHLSDNFNYRIFFGAKNGFWMEDLEIRRVKGIRLEALRVRRQMGNKTPLAFQKIDKGFPLVKGVIEWPK